MNKIADLRSQMPELANVHMQADGFCIWSSWLGDRNPVIEQTLEDYGGVRVASAETQDLWFFFSNDAFLACARLAVWGKFNSINVVIQTFPARLVVDSQQQKQLLFHDGFWAQAYENPSGFQVWLHESVEGILATMPGLGFKSADKRPHMAETGWGILEVDPRLPYLSSYAWYVLLQPVGSPLEKSFQNGWREFLTHLEGVLQRNKFRFTVNNYFLMFQLESLREFRVWCRELLLLIDRVKTENPAQYWPCVHAIIDRKGLNLNNELPQKVGIDWNQLSPDYPYVSMRNALMLGNNFVFHPVRFAPSRQSPDDWCSITLQSEEKETASTLPHIMSEALELGGAPHCFYCGLRSHLTKDCPSRHMPMRNDGIWKDVARMNFGDIVNGIHEIDTRLGAEEPASVVDLSLEGSVAGAMTRAYFDLTWPAQLRSAGFFWRLRGRDIMAAINDQLSPEDDNPIWGTLQTFADKDRGELDKELQSLSVRFPKDFRVASLGGFAALEKGDYEKAASLWKEAEVYSSVPAIQAWHIFLQARLCEFQGYLPQALQLYDSVLKTNPTWSLIFHRKLDCEIKRGFSEQMMGRLVDMINADGNFFNKFLIDPEMERGRIHISACLSRLWARMVEQLGQEETTLARLKADLGNWFLPDDPFALSLSQRIDGILIISAHNYVPYQGVIKGRMRVDRDFQQYIKEAARACRNEFKTIVDRLQYIQEESAWFPFPRVLGDFNKRYNQCAAHMNWALRANFQTADVFKKAQMLIEEEKERVKELEGRMRFLRIIRDATLFVLSLGETFFWIEVVGIIFIFVVLPLLLVYGDRLGLESLVLMVSKQRWQVQKLLFFFITISAMAIAGLRTVLGFEHIRVKVLAKAKAKAERQRQEMIAKMNVEAAKREEKKNAQAQKKAKK